MAEQKMGILAQFMEYFFGVSWVKEEVDHAALGAPRCSACHNYATRADESEPWRCPHHPRAALIEEPKSELSASEGS